MTPVPPQPQYETSTGTTGTRQYPLMDGLHSITFQPCDVARLASPTKCINGVCINGCILLLFSMIKPIEPNYFAVFSTYDHTHVCYNATDKLLWKAVVHTRFWSKDILIIPIHRPSIVGHWVMCIAYLSHRELRLFDNLGEQRPWKADIQVCTGYMNDIDSTSYRVS
jgi:Ulp1 family protease